MNTLIVLKLNCLVDDDYLRKYRKQIVEDIKEGVLLQTPDIESITIDNFAGEVGVEFLSDNFTGEEGVEFLREENSKDEEINFEETKTNE